MDRSTTSVTAATLIPAAAPMPTSTTMVSFVVVPLANVLLGVKLNSLGSGITPPQLTREVRASYTDDARRRAIEGDVVLEIVVRRDGSVGQVRVLQSLGAGLEQRAIDAVRQWRFTPATRQGTAVDVVVEVAVGFSLR